MKVSIQQSTALHEKGGRFKNEDFIYPILDGAQVDQEMTGAIPNIEGLYMVCDGIGGDRKGDVAAQLAVAQFAKYFATFPPNGQVTYGYLSAALLRVEEAFSNYIQAHPESRGMGTTLSLLYIDDYGATMAWIGNSRVYHYRNGEQLFKTRDHSVVNELLSQGELTDEEAREHPQRNVILRTIKGTEEPTDLDIHFIPVEELNKNDFFFLCTDGVLEEVNDTELTTLFSSELSAEGIRQEIFSLCKGISSDNFSCYLIELGTVDRAGVTPIFDLDDEEEDIILVDDVAEPPVEKISLEDEPQPAVTSEEPPTTEKATVLDSFKTKAEPVKEAAKAGTILDQYAKVRQQNIPDEDPPKEPAKEPQKAATPPASDESTANILLPVAMVVVLLLAVIAIVWILNRPNSGVSQYDNYMTFSKQSLDDDQWDRAMLYADSAAMAADKDLQRKQQASAARAAAIKGKRGELNGLLNKAAHHEGTKSYPDIWRAKQYYLDAKNGYRDVASDEEMADIDKKLDECNNALATFKATDALPQLVAKISQRCADQNPEEAGLYYSEAQRIADQLASQNALTDALKTGLGTSLDGCQNAGAIADASTARALSPAEEGNAEGDDSDTQARSLTPATQPAAGDVGEAVGDLKELATNNTAEEAAPITPQAPATTTAGGSSTPQTARTTQQPAANTSPSTAKKPRGSFLAERTGASTNPVARTRGMDDSQPAPPTGTPEELKALEKGKALFEKSRKTGSLYEAQKAAEYLTAANKARDGEANYMLAYLCHTGEGVIQDDPLAMALAKESALQGYAGGHYLYASLLLQNKNKVDSVTAKQSLNIAATKGFPAATDKLRELQNSLTARLRN